MFLWKRQVIKKNLEFRTQYVVIVTKLLHCGAHLVESYQGAYTYGGEMKRVGPSKKV